MNKIDKLENTHTKAKQTEIILLNRPGFIGEIKRLRINWKISEGGMQKHEFGDWNTWITENKDYVPTDKDWELEIKRNQLHARLTNSGIPNLENLYSLKGSVKLSAVRVFKNDIANIIRIEDLDLLWFEYVKHFLLFNKPIRVPSKIAFSAIPDEESGLPYIALKITGKVSRDDIANVWEGIRKYQDELPDKVKKIARPKRALERDELAYMMMRKDGKSIDEIIEVLNRKYPKKGAHNYYDYNEVYRMINRFKQLTR